MCFFYLVTLILCVNSSRVMSIVVAREMIVFWQ